MAEQIKLTEDEETVLAAIDAKYRTFAAIALQLELPANELDGLLAQMVEDRLIRREEKGDLTAYFRYEEKPTNFYRSGGGRVEAEFEKPKGSEDVEMREPLTPKQADELLDFKRPSADGRKTRGPNVEYTPEFFREAGRRGKNQGDIAEEMGRHRTTICYQLGKPENRKAYEEGFREFRGIAKTVEDEPELSVAVDAFEKTNGYLEFKVTWPAIDLVEDMPFNLGTAVVCICQGDISAAISYLERERSRRERHVNPVRNV